MNLSYAEYLSKTGKPDSRESWIDWKIDCCGMTFMAARRASYYVDWSNEKGGSK